MPFLLEALGSKIVIQALNTDQRRKPQAISVEEKNMRFMGSKWSVWGHVACLSLRCRVVRGCSVPDHSAIPALPALIRSLK